MTTFLLLAAIVTIVLFALRAEGRETRQTKPTKATAEGTPSLFTEKSALKYRDKFRLLTPKEITLYRQLIDATPSLLVFTQVSLSQVFHINRFTPGANQQLNEIGRKSVDFLLCRQDTSIVLAIELNGSEHSRADRTKSDEKKKNAFETAGIPLVVLGNDEIPMEAQELRKLIAPFIVERHRYEQARDTKNSKN